MGFHITQPGSSVATSLIEGESKQKHVLLLEIKVKFWANSQSSPAAYILIISTFPKDVVIMCPSDVQGNQYRPTKIPLASVRPFEYTEVVSFHAVFMIEWDFY